jgi:hypothetical protein
MRVRGGMKRSGRRLGIANAGERRERGTIGSEITTRWLSAVVQPARIIYLQ